MITNFLLDHAALVPVALLLVVLVTVAVGVLAERSGRHARRAAALLLALAVVAALVLTLLPGPRYQSPVFCTVQFALPGLGTVELLANIALFVPIGFFALLAWRRPPPAVAALAALAAASGLSALIETIQGLVPGIGRACDTNDWLMNTIGAAVGVAVAVLTLAVLSRRRPDASPVSEPDPDRTR